MSRVREKWTKGPHTRRRQLPHLPRVALPYRHLPPSQPDYAIRLEQGGFAHSLDRAFSSAFVRFHNFKKTGTDRLRAFSRFQKTSPTGLARGFLKLKKHRPTDPRAGVFLAEVPLHPHSPLSRFAWLLADPAGITDITAPETTGVPHS